MYTAMLTLCLGLSLGQVANLPSDVAFYNTRSFRFPLKTQGRQADIREMRLFVSNDQGKSWQQHAVVAGDKEYIVFNAPTDGMYWIQVAAVGLDGRQEPENIYAVPPHHIRKMFIDTLKPFVRITEAQRHGEEIHVAWEIQEDHPDWASFKLEYQVEPLPQWTEAQVTPSHIGKTNFQPMGHGMVTLRMKLRDRAGNVTFVNAEVPGHGGLAQPNTKPSVIQAGAQETPPPLFPPQNDVPPPPAPVEQKKEFTPPPVKAAMPPVGSDYVPPNPAPYVPPSAPSIPTPTPPAPAPSWTPNVAPNTAIHHHGGNKLVASSDTPPVTPPAAAPAIQKQRPPVQYVNSPEITLEYELTKVGPSGVGSVDLWWTRDDGQTWEKYAWDPEAKGPGRHQRTVELPGDGVYGFQIVVKSRAGMGRREPRPGDAPEIRVEVDTLPPIAQLYVPVPDTQRGNSLILTWMAKDANLTSHPITLEWSERREGPWHPIAANLPNTGRHSWHLPDQLPVQVYLRIRARDCAGNEGVAVTGEPQLVDLSEPEGRLITVTVPSPRR